MNKLNYSIEVITFDDNLSGVKLHKFASRGAYYVNSAIIETRKSLVIFDVQDSTYALEFINYINQLNKPISRVIISHPHIDHYSGLPFFSNCPSYSTKEIIKDFKLKNIEAKYIPKFELEREFNIDNISFKVSNVVDSHCPNHLVLWAEELSCVFVGDLAQYNGHLLAYDYLSFIKALEYIQQQSKNYTILITGHGVITTVDILTENINYLKECYKIYLSSNSIESFDERVRQKFPNRSKIKVNLGFLLKNKPTF